MISNQSKQPSDALRVSSLHLVGENLYRVQSPNDRIGKPTGGYYALLKRGGKQFRRSLKTKDRKLAERRLAELRKQVGSLIVSADANLSFEKTTDHWMAATSHTLKSRSKSRRLSAIKAVAKFFRGLAIRNITKSHCERWLTKRGSQIAPQTFAHELSVMKRTFAYAVDSGLILNNPAAHIKRRRILQTQIVVPTREQFQQLIAAVRHSDGRVSSQKKSAHGAALIELLAYSGARVGEATTLRWRDVNFDKNVITITGGEELTKNSETRVVPMTDALSKLLLGLFKTRRPKPADLVSKIKDCKTTLHKTCKRLGLPDFTHHDFRHFFATTCIKSGVDIPTISRWLGHKDGGALAMRVYGHLRQDHSFAQIKRVSFDEPQIPAPPTNVAVATSANRDVPLPGGAVARI